MVTSGVNVFTVPDWLIIKSLSSPLNSPISSPRPSTLIRCTVSSNQILRGFKVETPFSLSSIFFILYFVTWFPLEARPLIKISAKSIYHVNFLILPA